MLLGFRFTNHRSFRWEQELILTPVYGSDHVAAHENLPAVRVAGIFGANASGKSNSLHALVYMRELAIRSDREVEPGFGLARHPFRLDKQALTEPSRYVVELSIDGIRHSYGFSLNDEGVLEEWLYHYPLKKKRNIFERTGFEFKWGEESRKHDELEQIASITAPTALFLSTAARFERTRPAVGSPTSDPLRDVYRWFYRMRTHTRNDPRRLPSSMLWPDSGSEQEVVRALLRAADVGIVDVRLKPLVQEALFPDTGDSEPIESAEIAARRRASLSASTRQRVRRRLEFTHRGSREDVTFELADESTGTQQLLDLAIDAASTMRAKSIMVVDEIDASLHPMLTAKLIGIFQNGLANSSGSQLLFTSHDAALLGTFDTEEVLFRDQIWFTEKDDDGTSSLYPLSEFKPRREGENRQRRYLNGNYGGVPDLSSDVFEQALLARGELDGER